MMIFVFEYERFIFKLEVEGINIGKEEIIFLFG